MLCTGRFGEDMDFYDYWSRHMRQRSDMGGTELRRLRSIDRAIVYIEATFFDSLSLDLIAQSACVSRFHFSRIFRAEMGKSPMQHVRWRRVMEAKKFIRAANAPFVKIADSLGYFDHSHFSREFRAFTGMRPNQYPPSEPCPK